MSVEDYSGDQFENDDSKLEQNGDGERENEPEGVNNEDADGGAGNGNEDYADDTRHGNDDEDDSRSNPRRGSTGNSNYIVNMHGLPYTITYEEIADFLEGMWLATWDVETC